MKLARKATLVALMNLAVLFGLFIFLPSDYPEPVSAPVVAAGGEVAARPANSVALPRKPQPVAVAPAEEVAPPPADNRCIVSVQGRSYDVTELRVTHSGGDIFRCGTDMTASFFGQHEQQLLNTVMRQYLIL